MSKDNTVWWVMLWREMAPELFPWIKYHWYSVRYVYKKDGRVLFNLAAQVGLRNRETILKAREIKKIYPPLHKHSDLPKKHLCNGALELEVICYLGKFKKPK